MERFKTQYLALTERSAAILNNFQRSQTLTERRANKDYTRRWDKDKFFMEDRVKNES